MPTLEHTVVTAATVRAAPPEEPTRNQRARVDFTVDSTSKLSPLETAIQFIESHTASLHDGLSDLLLLKGKELTSLRHRLTTKESAINKLESHETRIPVSARVDFKLSCMKGLEETPDFISLQSRNTDLVDKFRKDLKAHIVECGRLEIAFLKKQIATTYAKTLSQVVAMFHIAQGVDQAKTHPTALKLIADHAATLLKHTDGADFGNLYIQVNSVENMTDADGLNVNPRAADIHRTLESVFVTSWDLYLGANKARELALSLKRHMTEHVLTDMTEAAVNIVDQELPANQEQLHELIRKEIDRAAKKRQNKEASQTSKNAKRGQKKDGASQKNAKAKGKAAESKSGGNKKGGKKSKERSQEKSKNKSSSTKNAKKRKKKQS